MITKKVIWTLLIVILFLFTSTSALAAGNFSLGVYGGVAIPIDDEAIEDYSDTEWDSNVPTFGGSLLYRFPGGFTLGISIDHLEMDMEEKLGIGNVGTIKMTPVMFNILYQGMPYRGIGITGHGGIGFGTNFTIWNDDPNFLSNNYSIDTDNGFIFSIGGGIDYFFTKSFSMNLDARFLLGIVDCTIKYDDGFFRSIEDREMYISTFQTLLGLRFWF